ncbi:MAG: ribosome biogenesis GTPase Der [Candidatus Dependentiae bacterium]|nr:ribosome biogenesis GTPase Der [Candidatus Dependentiae bacterium]
MSKNPSVIIVGRMNVGKSTLFNRLSENVKSITLDYEGVTRDFIKDTVSWQGRFFDLIDTGGISLRKSMDPIAEKSRQGVLDLIQTVDAVLFVCDAVAGLTSEDREIGKLLHKSGKKTILVVNKMDSKISAENIDEFRQLGFETILEISAEHSRGIGDILDLVSNMWPAKERALPEEKTGCNVVLLGKPNVGKSSLMNLLLNKERSIVSEIAGTTREAFSETISFYQEDIQVTDTPGIRRKHSVTEDLESLMVKSSFRALQETDIVLLLIDASESKLADQELKLAFYAFTEKHKGLILLFNKQDLATEDSKEFMASSIDEYKYLIKKVPQLNISCLTGKNVGRVLPLVKEVCERYNQWITEEDLTILFKAAIERKPLYHKKSILIVYGAKQIKKGPVTILLIVNESDWFGPSQLMFFENLMRANYNLVGVPVRFVLRKSWRAR